MVSFTYHSFTKNFTLYLFLYLVMDAMLICIHLSLLFCFFKSTKTICMKQLTALLLFLLSTSIIAQKPVVDKRFAGLDTAFQRVLKDWHAAGFAVAVVEKNKVIYEKGFGLRDVENNKPVTANTLFAIGSCTKAFTASLIGLLQKDGKVDIDKPVETYLPAFKFFNDPMNNTITLRDMMSHRTGLPRHDASWYYFTSGSRDTIMQRIQYLEPTAAVRDKWQYNNFMFTAQGNLTEKFTGKSWEDNIRDKIFQPLRMSTSTFGFKEVTSTMDVSKGYSVKNDSLLKKLDYYNIGAMGPAGSINSSVHEMANWVITWINGGKFNGAEILPESFTTQAITPQAIAGSGLPGKEKPDIFFSTYGFGWMLSSYKGHYRVEHGGNINGFSASTSFFPTDSIGIVVLSNQDGSSVPGIVRNLIADRLLQQKYFDWNTDLKKSALKAKMAQAELKKSTASLRKPNTKPSHVLKDYTGSFSNPGYGNITVYLKNDSLFAGISDNILFLRHYHYDVFEPFSQSPTEGIDTTENTSNKIQFIMSPAGDVDRLSVPLEPGLKPIEFTRQVIAKPITATELTKYIGDYDLSGATVKVYVKNEKTLYVLVPGQPEYELVAVDKDRFSIKVAAGYFVQFAVDANNKTTELTFMQPNGNFKATKK